VELTTRIRDLRVGLQNRRTMRAAQRRLSDELASFRTPAERAELDHMLGRHTLEETAEIRAILNRQDYERQRQVTALGGYRR